MTESDPLAPLLPYLKHDSTPGAVCAVHWPPSASPCTCGLDERLTDCSAEVARLREGLERIAGEATGLSEAVSVALATLGGDE